MEILISVIRPSSPYVRGAPGGHIWGHAWSRRAGYGGFRDQPDAAGEPSRQENRCKYSIVVVASAAGVETEVPDCVHLGKVGQCSVHPPPSRPHSPPSPCSR